MENLIISYLIKVSLGVVLLYGLYILCFRNDTFNKIRRFYLLFILLFSIAYPFCEFEISRVKNIEIYEAILLPIEITTNAIDSNNQSLGSAIFSALLLIFVVGIIILFSRFLLQLISIVNLRLNNRFEDLKNYKLISINKDITPFSFFHWVFIPSSDKNKDELNIMIAHEEEHVNQYHSIDIIVSQLFCIAFWWNPIVWLLRKEIKMNLEYLADKGVLEKGIESRKYQYLLVQVIRNSATIQIVNNFNVSQLKKRIMMINKKKTSKFMSFKYLLAVPTVALILIGNVQNTFSLPIENVQEEIMQEKDKVYSLVEQMPMFSGGDNAMMQYIGANLKYPTSAATEKIEGRVVVRFVVTKLGEVEDVTILRSLDVRCDEEAMRVVREMPKWTPGKQNGQDVDVYYTLPVLYKLQKDTPQNSTSN